MSRLQAVCTTLMEAGWLAAAAIIPMFFDTSALETFELGKMLVLETIVLLSASAWVLRRISEGGGGIGLQIKSLLRKPLVLPVLALAVVHALSSFISVARDISWWGAYHEAQGTVAFFCYVILFLIVLAELRSPEQLQRIQYTIVLTSIPVSAYATLQHFGADPFPWKDTFEGRAGASMGNPIFLGGYLVMVIPLTIGRIIDGLKRLRDLPSRHPALVLACSCGIALMFQLVALLFTKSRGPLLGLAVAGYLCITILLVRNKSSRQSGFGAPAMAAVLGVIAPVFAIAAIYATSRFFPRYVFACLAVMCVLLAVSFLSAWKTMWGRSWLWLTFVMQPLILILTVALLPANNSSAGQGKAASFGRIIQLSDSGLKHREALWETGARFLRAGPQPMLPDGSRDSYAFLRSVLGYGPENTWLITNTFATPALVRFHWQESENRLHNETFGNLTTIGYAGTMVYIWLIAGAFYYSLRYLGFAFDLHGKIAFAVICCTGILAGFLIPWASGAVQFIGIGVDAGLIAGIFVFVAYSGIRTRAGSELNARQILIFGILGALFAHLIEIGVAISITPTRLYFYLYLALLAVLCSEKLSVREEPVRQLKTKSGRRESSPWLPFAASAAFVVLVQTWCFTYSSGNEESALAIFIQSWFGAFSSEHIRIPTALLLFLLTIFAGAALMFAETYNPKIPRHSLRKWIIRFAASLSAAWLVLGVISALFWTRLENSNPLEFSQHSEARITLFVLSLVLFMMAAALALRTCETQAVEATAARKFELIAGVFLAIGAGFGIWELSLRPTWGDICAQSARAYETVGDASSAAQLYERATQLSPHVIQYNYYLGLAQLRAAGADPLRVEQARRSFQKAQALNPLDPIAYRTLGTFHIQVGENSADPKIRTAEITRAIGYYEKAHQLAPNYPNAYNEKGRCLSLMGEYAEAEKIFKASIQLNPDYWRTYKYFGEMLFRQKNFAKAIDNFRIAAILNSEDLDLPKNIGVAYALDGRIGDAIRETVEALKKAPNDPQMLTYLASWYFSTGDYSSFTDYAKRAYEATPGPAKGSFANFKENLQNKTWP